MILPESDYGDVRADDARDGSVSHSRFQIPLQPEVFQFLAKHIGMSLLHPGKLEQHASGVLLSPAWSAAVV